MWAMTLPRPVIMPPPPGQGRAALALRWAWLAGNRGGSARRTQGQAGARVCGRVVRLMRAGPSIDGLVDHAQPEHAGNALARRSDWIRMPVNKLPGIVLQPIDAGDTKGRRRRGACVPGPFSAFHLD